MIAAVALTLVDVLSEGNSRIGRTLFVLTRWIYTALDKQRLFNENVTGLERHRWLLQKRITPVRTGSDVLSLKDIISEIGYSQQHYGFNNPNLAIALRLGIARDRTGNARVE
ncbi:hypothetical protein MC7420_6806 [Coleofasciculus chthonoplastes PCC 7420]|uniref:Uncharacterized protein n=1 Tax=Coleofasciculus chthonoplastes PCC 7420 TaxID=118168 RepID=B4VWA6_9CYAN|nr:hypothetical protein [Coleofasciculus chthonoplastes]EDX73758.1 hypothetical protein MC7420_6806 [Coleofasciculus chthonoplastes PCC 7420]